MPQNIVMPALSAGMEEGTIARWLKAEGDTVAIGEVIAEIETDKATMEMEAAHSGVIGSIVVGDGNTVPVNATIAVLLLDGESAADFDATGGMVPEAAAVAAPTEVELTMPARVAAKADDMGRVASSPLARRTAKVLGVSIEGLNGSGASGRVVRVDVERAGNAAHAIEAPPPIAPEPPLVSTRNVAGPYREVRNSNVRKVIARRLTDAKASIPHFYLNMECEIDALLELRTTLNGQSEGFNKLSVNDFIVKAAAIALKKVPEANAAWTEEAVRLYDNVDVSVAVATEGGLITPIVCNADRKRLGEISQEIRALAERAREGRLQPSEYQGGGFTISNLGMYGVHSFSAIINTPQSCILAIGAGERRAVVRGDDCVPATVMNCTLSVDHRSVDGAVGARYLSEFKALIEQPLQLAC